MRLIFENEVPRFQWDWVVLATPHPTHAECLQKRTEQNCLHDRLEKGISDLPANLNIRWQQPIYDP